MNALRHFTTCPPLPSPFPPPIHRHPPTRLTCTRTISPLKPISAKLPARDRIIDFGKHKGRMLGTLPSKYLKWVSNNLRARDFEEWAKLADEVLLDPVYQDRIEWESAEKILSGERARASTSSGISGEESPVSELLEISQRFGWDNEDKEGWKGVNFELLGTSIGGRIPRRRSDVDGGPFLRRARKGHGPIFNGRSEVGKSGIHGLMSSGLDRNRRELDSVFEEKKKKVDGLIVGGKSEVGKSRIHGLTPSGLDKDRREMDSLGEKEKKSKIGVLSKGHRVVIGEEEAEEMEGEKAKREERRERQRIKREQQLKMLRREIRAGEEGERDDDGGNRGGGIARKKEISGSRGHSYPFPGRDALLGKINRNS